MIRHGRSVVDRQGIATLHGLSWSTGLRQRPWALPGHPLPVNLPPGQRHHPHRPALWDLEQVRAYAQGKRVPPIDGHDHPDDLLDATEVAALHRISLAQFSRARWDNRVDLTVAGPDATPCGVEHWRRASAEAMKVRVDNPNPHRPTRAESAERQRRMMAALNAMAEEGQVTDDGQPRNKSEFARRANVTRVTVDRFLADTAQSV